MNNYYDLPKPSDAQTMRSKALTTSIRQAIDAEGGAISFSKFMDKALYEKELGYYQSKQITIGKAGDFTTAPHLSPLFAAAFANQFIELKMRFGIEHILEIGAGTGCFATDLLQTLAKANSSPQHYYIVEKSVSLQKIQQAFLQKNAPECLKLITWLEKLPVNFKGVIVANEVLDALPVDRFIHRHDEDRELAVGYDQDQFIWIERPFVTDLSKATMAQIVLNHRLPDDYISEIHTQTADFVKPLLQTLSAGYLFFFDYGYNAKTYYCPERSAGTLTAFYQHRQINTPFLYPGLMDLTAHVNFTQVAEIAFLAGASIAGFTEQSSFLLGAGASELISQYQSGLSEADLFNFNQGVKTLLFPTEMGERIKVMAISKNMTESDPLLGFQLNDRRYDL